MAFVTNSNQQFNFNDPLYSLTEREKKYLEKSWAVGFYKLIFSSINEERFKDLYSSNPASRPNTPVNVIFGALILKELFALTDDELIERMMFDMLFQHALGTGSFEEQPVSDRTFSRFRERLYNYEIETGRDLVQEEMEALADSFASFSGVNRSIRRMDSLMVASNCKKMSRLEIMYTCVANMVKRLKKQDELISDQYKHYLEEDDVNKIIYHRRSDGLEERLQEVIHDGVNLSKQVPDSLYDSSEFRLLQRVLREQTESTPNGPKPKDKAQIKTDSLQNPSDPDATYRKKAGKDHKGYTANIVELSPNEGPNYITHYDLKPNTYSDQSFAEDIIENLGEQEDELILIADGAFGSEDIKSAAKDNNIQLLTTALIGKSPEPILSEFQIDEEQGKVLSCPGGKEPIKTTYYPKTGMYRAVFQKTDCANCPYRTNCSMKEQKKSNVVSITSKTIARAKQVIHMGSQAYKEFAKKRNGIEGIPSLLRRRYDIDHVPVRGLVRLKTWLGFKIGAINSKRLLKSVQEPIKCS